MNKKEFFERNKRIVNRVVRGRLAKTKRVVHGTRATNAQLPRFLNKKTRDWDIFAKNPKKAAMDMEKALDKKFGGDFFKVKKGITQKLKVHKVVSTINEKGFVDYSVPDRFIPTISKRSIKFATLKDQVDRAKQSIQLPTTKFRREKDLDLLRRVKIFEKQRGKPI